MIEVLKRLGYENPVKIERDLLSHKWAVTLYANDSEVWQGQRRDAEVFSGVGFPSCSEAIEWLADNAAARYPHSEFAAWWRTFREGPPLPDTAA